MLCSTSTAVTPRAAVPRMSSSISRVSLRLSPAAGSSSSSSAARRRARGDLEALERPWGRLSARVRPAREPDGIEQRSGGLTAGRLSARASAGDRSSADAGAALVQPAPGHHVLEHRHVEEHLQVLERAADPDGGELVRIFSCELLVFEEIEPESGL